MRPNELWTRPHHGAAHTTEPPGQKPLVVNVVVVGLFEEEEEKISIASDVVKVQGEDLSTLGYLRGDRVRRDVRDRGYVPLGSLVMKPRDCIDSPKLVQ